MEISRVSRTAALLTGAATGLSGIAAVTLVGSLLALVLAIAPWLLFWSVGVLTGFSIPFTFKTWLAAVVFLGLVRGGTEGKK